MAEAPSPHPVVAEPVTTPDEPLSHLAGLISRVLESADQLADATRRTRKGERAAKQKRVTASEPGAADTSSE